jgi:hypothetical protein
MQSMNSDKLGDKSTIEILDLTRVNQASHTITLNKNSEMYTSMSQEDFNKQVKEQTGTTRSKVAVYIARAIQAFVKAGKILMKIPYFLSKFDSLSVYQFHGNITIYFELNKITLIMKPTLCCLVRIPKQWDNNSFELREHAEGSIQGFRPNFTKVSSLYTLIGRQYFSFVVNSILMLLHLKTVPRCTTLIGSIMASTKRAGSDWQSDTTSSMPNNSWALSVVGITHARILGSLDNTWSIMRK